VNDNDEPVPVASTYPYVQQPHREFKILPVHLQLVMDQRKLPQFLAECANVSMPIDVHGIRVVKSNVNAMEAAPTTPSPGAGNEGDGGADLGSMLPQRIHAVKFVYGTPGPAASRSNRSMCPWRFSASYTSTIPNRERADAGGMKVSCRLTQIRF
jgi:hypothetical protein